MYEIGKRIKFLRVNMGISAEELADKLNANLLQLAEWENSHSMPPVDKLVKISQTFNVTLDYLILGNSPDLSLSSHYEVSKSDYIEFIRWKCSHLEQSNQRLRPKNFANVFRFQ